MEAALHDVSGRLLDEAVALERDAARRWRRSPSGVSAASLEKTRGIKAAMNSLAARVEAAREALEKLLQDDADMAAMRLSRGDDEALHEDASDDGLQRKPRMTKPGKASFRRRTETNRTNSGRSRRGPSRDRRNGRKRPPVFEARRP